MPKIRPLLLLAICAGSLAACGQVGPLYLPKPAATPLATHAAPAAGTVQAPAAASLSPAAPAAVPAPQPPLPRLMP